MTRISPIAQSVLNGYIYLLLYRGIVLVTCVYKVLTTTSDGE